MWLFELCNKVVRFEDKILKRPRFIPRLRASKGEREVERVLNKHGIRFTPQYELGYFIHADFAVYYRSRIHIIEYDGRQHYHPVKYFGGWRQFLIQRFRDIIENIECKDRKMPILRIRYDVPFDLIEPMILDFLQRNNE